jgi:hypothetical protein
LGCPFQLNLRDAAIVGLDPAYDWLVYSMYAATGRLDFRVWCLVKSGRDTRPRL